MPWLNGFGRRKRRNRRRAKLPKGSRWPVWGRTLGLELLEDRVMLSTFAWDSSSKTLTVTGESGAEESIYFRIDNGKLQWSEDNNTYEDRIDSGASDPIYQVGDGDLTITVEAYDSDNTAPKTYLVYDMLTDGDSLSITSEQLTVMSGVVVSTRDIANSLTGDHDADSSEGDSGALSFVARTITVDTGAALFAHVEDGSTYSAGDVTLDASDTADSIWYMFAQLPSSAASITFDDATVRGGAVTLDAHADADLADDDTFFDSIVDSLLNVSFVGGYAKSTADATIAIHGGAIDAESLDVDALAETEASIQVVTIFVAAAVGYSKPTATVTIDEGAQIDVEGDATINAETSSVVDLVADQAFTVSTAAEKVNITLAIATSESTAISSLSGSSQLTAGGAVTISSLATKDHEVDSTATAYADGVLGLALIFGFHTTTAESLVDASTITAGGDVSILAEIASEDSDNYMDANAKVGSGMADVWLTAKGGWKSTGSTAVGNLASGGLSALFQKLPGIGSKYAITQKNWGGLAGGFVWGETNDTARARVGQASVIESTGGDVFVLAETEDVPRFAARASLANYATETGVVNPRNRTTRYTTDVYSGREYAAGFGVVIGQITANAYATVESDAVIIADDVTIQSAATIPYEDKWWRWDSLDAYQDKANSNLGIANGFFASWAQARSSGEEGALGGSVNVFIVNTTSRATVDERAAITATGDVVVEALAENDAIHFAGYPFVFGANSGGTGIGIAVIVSRYINDVKAEIRDDAVVTADTLLVHADLDTRAMGLAVQGGIADGFAFNGGAVAPTIQNSTIARIDEGAILDIGDGRLVLNKDFDYVSGGDGYLTSDIPLFNPNDELDDGSTRVAQGTVDSTTYGYVQLPYEHELQSGDAVVYYNPDDEGADITGLSSGTTYFAVVLDESTLALSTDYTSAASYDGDLSSIAATLVNFSVSGDLDESNGHGLYPGFDPTADGVIGDDNQTIELGFEHGLVTGQPVLYDTGGDTAIDGLTHDTVYYVIVANNASDATSYQLALTEEDALAGTAITLDASTATTNGHTLRPLSYDKLPVESALHALDTNDDGQIDTDDEHVYLVDDNAYYLDLSLLVLAEDDSSEYTGAGGVTVGQSTGVGVSVVVNRIDRNTRALIGDLSLPLAEDDIAPGVGVHSDGTIHLGYTHGLTDGDAVVYTSGGDFTIDGLFDAQDYYATVVDSTTIRLARSALEAVADGSTFFDAGADVGSLGTNVIDLGCTHGFQLGDRVEYVMDASASEAVGGLTAGDAYYVLPISSTAIALADVLYDYTDINARYFVPKDNVDSDQIFVGSGHGWTSGRAVRYSAGGGVALDPLTDGEVYYVIETESDTLVKLAGSYADAVAGTALTLDPSDATGCQHSLLPAVDFPVAPKTFEVVADVASNRIDLGIGHGLQDGDIVRYLTDDGAPVDGLEHAEVYYVIDSGNGTIQLAASAEDAGNGTALTLDPTTATGTTHLLVPSDHEDAGYVDPANDLVDLGLSGFGFLTGDAVRYVATDSQPLGGLVDGELYYALEIDDGQFALTATEDDAEQGRRREFEPDTSLIDLVGDSSYDTISLMTDHGYSTGDPLLYQTLGDTAVTGLIDGETYYVITVEDTDARDDEHELIQLASSADDAANGIAITGLDGSATGAYKHYLTNLDVRIGLDPTGVTGGHAFLYEPSIDLTAGSEAGDLHRFRLAPDPATATTATHAIGRSFDPAAAVSNDQIDLGYNHGFSTGDAVQYTSGSGDSIDGLAVGETYYVVVVNETTIQLAESEYETEQDDPEVLELSATDATGTSHAIGAVLRAAPTVDAPTDTITLSVPHGYETGDAVTYTHGDEDSAIGGLADDGKYYVIKLDSLSFQLAASKAEATAATPVAIDLDPTQASGTDHALGGERTSGQTLESGGGVLVAAANAGAIGSLELAASFVSRTNFGARFSGANLGSSAGSDRINTGSLTNAREKFGFAFSGAFGVNVVTDTTLAQIQNATILSAGDVAVRAINNTEIFIGAGAVAIVIGHEDSAAFGMTVLVNVVVNDTLAEIASSTIDAGDDVIVAAEGTGSIVAIALSIGVSNSTAAGAGTVVVNRFDDDVRARIDDSFVVATDDVSVAVNRDEEVYAFAGALGVRVMGFSEPSLDYGGAAGITIASNAIVDNDEGALAEIVDSDVTAGGDVEALATSGGSIWSLAAAASVSYNTATGSVGYDFAVAFSLGVNLVGTSTQARISGKKSQGISAAGTLTVDAEDDADIVAVVGTLAIAASKKGSLTYGTGIGASIAVNTIQNTVTAEIDQSTVQASTASITSTVTGEIYSYTIAAAGANTVAVGGALSVNHSQQTIHARVKNSTDLTTTGDITVRADNDVNIFALAPTAAISTSDTSGSLGIAIVYNGVLDEVKAYVDSSSVTSSSGSVTVEADTVMTSETIAIGIGSSNTGTFAGSSGVAKITTTVEAYITDSTVDAYGNVCVLANQDNTVEIYGGALAFGKSSFGVGGTVMVTLAYATTKAYVADSTVMARGNGTAATTKTWNDDGTQTTATTNGLAVIADSSLDYDTISGSLAISSAGWGVSFDISPAILDETTKAYIDNSDVNSSTDDGQDVVVRAHRDTDFLKVFGAGAFASGVSVAAAIDFSQVGGETKAYITDSDTTDSAGTIYAGDDVEVRAFTREQIETWVFGVAISKSGLAIAGSATPTGLVHTTEAYIKDATVKAAGDVTIAARDVLDLNPTSVSVAGSIGGSGGGGTFYYVNDQSQTSAFVSGATIDATGTLLVSAERDFTSSPFIANISASSSVTVNGTINILILEAQTHAYIQDSSGRSAAINQDASYRGSEQDVTVSASNVLSYLSLGGTFSMGSTGVGGTIEIVSLQNTVEASIRDGVEVYAERDITVSASADRDLQTYVGGLSISGGTGVTGTIALVTVNGGFFETFAEIGSDTISEVNNTLSAGNSSEGLADDDAQNELNNTNDPTVDDAFSTTDVSTQDILAYIGSGATVSAGNDLEVSAEHLLTIVIGAGTVTGSGSTAVGGTIGMVGVHTVTEALVATDAVISAGDVIQILANAEETVDVEVYAGSVSSSFALGAQYGLRPSRASSVHISTTG